MPGKRKRSTRVYKPRKRTAATKKYVRSAVKRMIETKELRYTYSDLGLGAGISYGSGTIIRGFYGALQVGAAQNQRVGNSVRAVGVRFDVIVTPADTTNQVRFLVLSPKRYGTRYQPSDIANFTENVFSGHVSGATQYLAPVDTSRWKVHYDRTNLLRHVPTYGSGGVTDVYPIPRHFKGFIRFPRKIQWDDEGEIASDLYMVAISDSGVPVHPYAISGYAVAYFKDA